MTVRRVCHENLREFVNRLEVEGELIRIAQTVSPVLEITEIADRVSKSTGGGKALFFENVEGSSFPVLINAFGGERRMAMALGVNDVEEIAGQIRTLLNTKAPDSFAQKIKMLAALFEAAKFPPKKSSAKAPCQEVVVTGKEIDLFKFPVLKCWPLDAGRFITLPVVFTESPEGRRNVGMYRMQVFDKNTTGMHWHIHKDGAYHFHQYKKANMKMPVAVAIGTDPAVTYAATAPLPKDIDELLLAGLIRKKGVRLVKCKTNGLHVPAEAEIILEGYVDPSEEFRLEGPFGDHTGYYSLADKYPVFHVTAITHRRDPIYSTTIVGKPPMEDCYMGRATSRIFLPMLQTVTPEVADYDLPWEGVFHNCVIVSIEKRYPAAAQRLMNALWGTGQMSFSKIILAVDEAVDVHDYREVFRTFLNNFDAAHDLFHSEGILDVLDHSSPLPLRGSKLGLDATSRLVGETARQFSELSEPDYEVIKKETKKHNVAAFHIPETGTRNRVIVCAMNNEAPGHAPKDGPKHMVEEAGNLLSGAVGGMANIIVVVDGDIDPQDLSTVTWKVFNNTDPARDVIMRAGKLVVDATKKTPSEGHPREWPDEIVMDEKTARLVDEKWPKLGI